MSASALLARAFAFVLRADMAGTVVTPFRWGTVVRLPESPRRHDGNYLLVDDLPAEVEAPALAAEAERLLGGAGLAHRMVMFRDAPRGEALAPGLCALGWTVSRGVVMAHAQTGGPRVPPARVVEVDAAVLRTARETHLRTYPWATPEVIGDLLDARAFLPVPARHFAVFEGGEPVAWVELYAEDGVAQVEALATLPAHRNRGHASALVRHAVGTARRGGADLVFLVADAEDWPRHLYARLGFCEIGRYLKALRAPP